MSFQPTAFVDISETLEVKLKAVHAHPSQFNGRGLDTDFLVDVARALGRMAGVPYAEGLEVMHLMIS